MQYIFVYILWGVHFKLRMLSLGVMLYILIYVCRSLDSLQGLICIVRSTYFIIIHIECLFSRVFTLNLNLVFFYPSVNYLFPA